MKQIQLVRDHQLEVSSLGGGLRDSESPAVRPRSPTGRRISQGPPLSPSFASNLNLNGHCRPTQALRAFPVAARRRLGRARTVAGRLRPVWRCPPASEVPPRRPGRVGGPAVSATTARQSVLRRPPPRRRGLQRSATSFAAAPWADGPNCVNSEHCPCRIRPTASIHSPYIRQFALLCRQ